MKTQETKNKWSFKLILIFLFLVIPSPGVLEGADVPSAEDVAFGKATLPTIEELTGGKVKEGDLINKDNMNIVKDFLTEGQIGCIEAGMVMRMANHKLKPLDGTTVDYNKITEKNRGKAIINEDTVTVWYETEGKYWPGGYPFPEPKTAAQVMAALKFGIVEDDLYMIGWMDYVNKDGKMYKTQGYWGWFIWVNTRVTEPHTWPGYEDQMFRKTTCFRTPTEAKGLGGFNIRFYDDTAQYDQGFFYHPAFKKTGRSNATTWMNNTGGTDFTYGDGFGFQDPMVDWNFKYLGTQYKLHSEFVSPFPLIDDNQRPVDKLKYDVGRKFPRFGYAVIPFHVVEATPKIRHVYGKKILYVMTYRYNKPEGPIPMMDAYDTQK